MSKPQDYHIKNIKIVLPDSLAWTPLVSTQQPIWAFLYLHQLKPFGNLRFKSVLKSPQNHRLVQVHNKTSLCLLHFLTEAFYVCRKSSKSPTLTPPPPPQPPPLTTSDKTEFVFIWMHHILFRHMHDKQHVCKSKGFPQLTTYKNVRSHYSLEKNSYLQ